MSYKHDSGENFHKIEVITVHKLRTCGIFGIYSFGKVPEVVEIIWHVDQKFAFNIFFDIKRGWHVLKILYRGSIKYMYTSLLGQI